MKNYHWKIGTRGSLLALAQTGHIKSQLEQLGLLGQLDQSASAHTFEVITIRTQGDQVTDRPLWQLEGKDFFTKELDQALLNEEVDFVIHSHKDLGTERPLKIHLAAITKREYAHDLLLIKASTIRQLKDGEFTRTFKVGTSSPRRMYQSEKSLMEYLPGRPHLEAVSLRGNVPTRIEKLLHGEFDAIVLALAGVERLLQHPSSRHTLEKLLKPLSFMVLPPSDFPPAAAQGALAIECLDHQTDLINLLSQLDDQTTREEVQRERKAFKEYGGGCHLAMGITVRKTGPSAYFILHKGKVADQDVVLQELERKDQPLPPPIASPFAFFGMPSEKVSEKTTLSTKEKESYFLFDDVVIKKALPVPDVLLPFANKGPLYATSSHVIPFLKKFPESAPLWAAGAKTMRSMAAKGFWANGSADSMGMEELVHLQKSEVVRFMQGDSTQFRLKILTHDFPAAPSLVGDIIPCYTREISPPSEEFHQKFSNTRLFFWTSFHQYQTYVKIFPHLTELLTEDPSQLQHCCGIGKTFEEFQRHGISVLPFINHESFFSWVHPCPPQTPFPIP